MHPSTGVRETNAPPDKKALGKISLKNTKSGTGEEFLLLRCRAKAHGEELFFFTDTGSSGRCQRGRMAPERTPACRQSAGHLGSQGGMRGLVQKVALRDVRRWSPFEMSLAADGLSLENNFAMCFLLEIPLRGFPLQIELYDKCRIPKNNTHLIFKGFRLKRKSPQGDLKQETYRKHPVLFSTFRQPRKPVAHETRRKGKCS